MAEYRKILGINYFTGSLDSLLAKTGNGGLIVVPAAPNLADLDRNPHYRQAVENAEFAITDSSLLVLLWFIRKGELLTRISGLQFMRGLIHHPEFRKERATFWVMPSEEDMTTNLKWLGSQGITVQPKDCYVAPQYPKGLIEDDILLAAIETHRTPYIVINIGGGIQEVLGRFLAARLSYKPTIICTGAAIAFLSGRQANIHPWVDKLMLAWLARCLHEPRKFVPRYLLGVRLIPILLMYAERRVAPSSD